MPSKYDKLIKLSNTVFDIAGAHAVLSWDQQTHMPPGGVEGRTWQLTTLSRLAHEHFVSDEFGEALDGALREVEAMDPDSHQARVVRRLKRDFDKRRRVSVEWVEAFNQKTSQAFEVWKRAREHSDFAAFRPYLEEIAILRKAYADFFAPYEHVYDPLLDDYEPGMKTAQVKVLFDQLRAAQVKLVEAIAGSPHQVDDSFLHQAFDGQKQWGFGLEVIGELGYDFERGRQDKAPHPFTTAFNQGDVRITNRIDPEVFGPALTGCMHEAGHAMYNQGISPSLERIPTLSGSSLDSSHHASMGLHESQSRMMENLVGRSRSFWKAYYPKLQAVFPAQLGQVDLESFYRAFNRVQPSLIRVEADEATYNLHIMLRFEIELGLMEGTLDAADLPEIWKEGMQNYLGLTPPNDALGVLQDIHWSYGYIGYFPTYTLGNLIAAQLWEQIEADIPDIWEQIQTAQFSELLGWLRENIHQYGAKYTANELLQRVVGADLTAQPYLSYLQRKYSDIYQLA